MAKLSAMSCSLLRLLAPLVLLPAGRLLRDCRARALFPLFVFCSRLSDAHSVCAFKGVNFMEKTISIRNTEITFSIWDLGGQREFVNMLPLVW